MYVSTLANQKDQTKAIGISDGNRAGSQVGTDLGRLHHVDEIRLEPVESLDEFSNRPK